MLPFFPSFFSSGHLFPDVHSGATRHPLTWRGRVVEAVAKGRPGLGRPGPGLSSGATGWGPKSQVGQRPGVLVGEGIRIRALREGSGTPAAPLPALAPGYPSPSSRIPAGFPHQWLTGPAPLRAEVRQVPPVLPRLALRRLRSSGSAPRPPGQLHPSRLTGRRGSAPDAPAKRAVPTRPGHLSSRATSCRCQSAR